MAPVSPSEEMDDVRHMGDGMETPVYTIEENNKSHSQNGFSNHAYVDHADTDAHAHVNTKDTKLPDETETGESSDDQFRSLVPFCLFFGIGSLFSSSLNTFLSSQITVIERSFGLSSSKSGILLSANDVGFVATILFSSHFLKNSHVPRILAICVLTFGIAGILTSLPHFIVDEKMPTQHTSLTNSSWSQNNGILCHPQAGLDLNNSLNNCDTKRQTPNPNEESDNKKGSLVLIIIGTLMLVQGVAKGPRQALSSVFIDNNSEKTKTGFYIGLLSSFTIFGPFIAILVGGVLNKLPVDLKETNIQLHDPRWVGAWWLGFIIFGVCAVLSSFPLFCFPASMRKRRHHEEDKNGAEYANTSNTDRSSFCYMIKDIPKSVMRVFMCPVYVSNLVSIMTTMFAIMVLGSFGPKYIENQFQIPTWKANIVLGLEKLATTTIGTFCGGVITRRFRLGLLGCIKMLFLSRVISSVCGSFLLLFGCERPDIVGYDTESPFSANLSCDCSSATYLPVCGDGQTFFSPCHAGCQTEQTVGYSNCTGSVSGNVEPGICDTGCHMLIPFVAINAFASLIGTASISPAYVVMLRSIDPRDRAMAVGLQGFLLSLLVFLPAPIILGKLFDSFCLVWKDSCAEGGSCSLYDNSEMRFKLISIEIGFKVASLIATLCAFLFARRWAAKHSTEKTYELETKAQKPPVPQPRLSLQGDKEGEN